MKCVKCGRENIEGSTFCVGCGEMLANQAATPVTPATPVAPVENVAPVAPVTVNQTPEVAATPVMQHAVETAPKKNIKFEFGSAMKTYLKLLIGVFTKPVKTINEYKETTNEFLTPSIFAGIIAFVMMLISLISTIISTVHVDTLFEGTKWEWSYIKEVPWAKSIFGNFFLYLAMIFGVAVIYYLTSLIIKKQISYTKSLIITAYALIPVFIANILLAPIFGLITYWLAAIIGLIGFVYTIVLLNQIMNKEFELDGEKKLFVNVIVNTLVVSSLFYLLIGSVGDVLIAIVTKEALKQTTNYLGGLSSLFS